MPKIPPLKYRDLTRTLRKNGFTFRRATGGSHEIWWNQETKKTCVVPHHKEVKPGTVRSIIRQTDIPIEQFSKQQ